MAMNGTCKYYKINTLNLMIIFIGHFLKMKGCIPLPLSHGHVSPFNMGNTSVRWCNVELKKLSHCVYTWLQVNIPFVYKQTNCLVRNVSSLPGHTHLGHFLLCNWLITSTLVFVVFIKQMNLCFVVIWFSCFIISKYLFPDASFAWERMIKE